MRKWLSVVSLIILAAGSVGCASRGFVRTQIKGVNDKVETMSQSLEQTQERTRKNEEAISAVEQKTLAAQGTANQARQDASAADAKARAAGSKAETAEAKADELDKLAKRLVYSVVLSEDQGQFSLGKATLPDTAKTRIDELVTQLQAEPKGVYFEVEGYTDSTGDAAFNERIGLERAEAVKRYLFEQHNVPLHKINVISYGEKNPVAPNNTRQGRAQNRRVVIRVVA